MDLTGSTAMITGAARRVGAAIALELARRGCDIGLHCRRSRRDAESVARDIRGMSRRCVVIEADLTDPNSWSRLVETAVGEFGSLDILVNNAAIFETMPLADFNLDDWDRMFRINVTAVAGLCHHAAAHLARSGRGCIVNLTDIVADTPWSNHLAYCASKAALVNLTQSLAKALAPAVRVNAVAPGIAVFPEHYDQSQRAALTAKVPMKRPGTPGDIARAVAFLCAGADYITGQVIAVDGGRSIA